MSSRIPALLTVGEIARRLDRPMHRIEYLLRSRHVKPSGRAGNALVYGESDVTFIAAELQRMDAERSSEVRR
jgi:hypothetical protein